MMKAEDYFFQGNAFIKQNAFSEAIECFKKAVQIKPDFAEAYHNLGSAVENNGGSIDIAVKHYKSAIRCHPQFAEAHYNLGIVLLKKGEDGGAADSFIKAIQIKPNFAEAYYHLGKIFENSGQLDVAVRHYGRAVQLNDHEPLFFQTLGDTLLRLDQLTDAVSSYQLSLKLKENQVVYNHLGIALERMGRFDEAIENYRKALDLNQNYADAGYNLGTAFLNQGRLEAAIKHLLHVIRIQPDYIKAHNNLANAYKHRGEISNAVHHYRQAIQTDPDSVDAHINLGMTLLLAGEFVDGWKEYEWRLKYNNASDFLAGQATIRKWDGSPFGRKKLIIIGEQGLGDTIQFVRYLPRVKTLGGFVALSTAASMIPLLRDFESIDLLLDQDDDIDVSQFDYYIHLLSLPGIFGTTLKTIPNEVPYLKADPVKINRWQGNVQGNELHVGLVWAGNPQNHDDRNRSINPDKLQPLSQIGGVKWYGLQKGSASGALELLPKEMTLENYGDRFDDFSDTAGMIANMDLIIAVDTAAAHLAGAMGKPVWLLRAYTKYWVWMLDREDSPWYPNLRIFRQKEPGNWDEVIERVASELAALCNLSFPKLV